jgi:hypothetical protein
MPTMKKRDTGSKQFDRSPSFFGKYPTFADAFPSIASVVGVVKIDGHNARGLGEPRRFDESTRTEIVDCPDRLCRGGFQFSVVLQAMVDSKEKHKEGTAECSGQRGAAPLGVCVTQFTYTVDIVYK